MAARREKPIRLPGPPTDPHDIRVVPELALRFPEAYTERENEKRRAYCLNRRRHTYVRSVSYTLKTKVTPDAVKHWKVEQSQVWCWDCGSLSNVLHTEDIPISEEEYEALKAERDAKSSYQGNTLP